MSSVAGAAFTAITLVILLPLAVASDSDHKFRYVLLVPPLCKLGDFCAQRWAEDFLRFANKLILAIAFCCCLFILVAAKPVTLRVNKVGPYNNPQETYNYYSLPFCHASENHVHKWRGLDEVLGGNELIDSDDADD